MTESSRHSFVLTGKAVAGLCVSFFAVIISVNICLAWFAIATNSGEVATEPYRKGLHYNDRIAADERQAGLGWKQSVELEHSGRSLRVTITDRHNLPVRHLSLEGTIAHPATRKGEATLLFHETTDGSYLSEVVLSPGGYIADITAKTASDPENLSFRGRQRLWLNP
jgi:nitrogen fixation protein FixH